MKKESPGQRLKRLRMKCGYSLRELGAEIGLSFSHLWELESEPGKIHNASYANLSKIAKVLGVTVDELMA